MTGCSQRAPEARFSGTENSRSETTHGSLHHSPLSPSNPLLQLGDAWIMRRLIGMSHALTCTRKASRRIEGRKEEERERARKGGTRTEG